MSFPAKMPTDKFCKYAKPTRLYQLPPSPEHLYKRYGEVIYSTGGDMADVYHNEAWGAKETIDALVALAKDWKSEADVLEIGDISAWNGSDIGHRTHRDGYGVDIRSDKVGAMEKNGAVNKKYDRAKSVDFAKKSIEKGFKYIHSLCPHVTKECNATAPEINGTKYVYVNQVELHHHHFHMDFWQSGSKITDDHIDRYYCNKCGMSSSCESKHKK